MQSKYEFISLICFSCLFIMILSEKNIFDETYIKHLKLKNRFFRGSVGDNYFVNGKITEEGFKLYDQLSKNEVLNIFTGGTAISDYDAFHGLNIFRIDKDEYIPEYKKLVDMVHKNGANFFMQLVHCGYNVINTSVEVIYSPSSLPIKGQNRNSKEMTKEDIIRIQNDFADAALRAKKAGFDGVEIHAAHFYLISEFLSPLYNKRTDEYGGTDENRARFLIETIHKVREKVGNEYIVGIKINGEDGDKNGITEEGFIKTCLMAEKAGIDYIQISGGRWYVERTKVPIYEEIGTKLAKLVKIPIIITSGARNVDNLNEILNRSDIQYFGIVRPLICEYDILKKWKNNESKKAKCVSCNSCLTKHFGICVFNKKKCDIKLAEPAPFQTIQLNDYKITYLPDGEGRMIPTLSYPQTIDEDWQKYKSYLTSEGKNLISLGGFLIEYKKEKILMDLGIGDRVLSLPIAEFEGGELLNNLKKAGVDRKDITKVIYTHLHTDHIGWTSIEENGKQVLTFPNAEYYCSQYDWEFWKDKTEDPLGVDEKKFIEALKDKIKFVKDGEELIPGLYVKFEFGHTPGLINLILTSGDKKLWFMSDLVHTDLQFKYPYWCFVADNNEERSIKRRINAFEELSKPNIIIANGHFIEGAFGYLKKEGEENYKFERYNN